MSAQILQRIATLTQPTPPKAPWDFLGPVKGIRQFCGPSSALQEQLEQEFTSAQLTAAGVLVPSKTGDRALSPVLQSEFLVLRPKHDALPFDFVNCQGALASDDPPAFQCCEDCFTRAWSADQRRVLAAFSDDDLAVLRRLQIPATPAAGLDRLSSAQVLRLLEEIDSTLPAPKNLPAVRMNYWRISLVDCNVAAISGESPPGIQRVISRLQKAEDAYGTDSSRIFDVWRPRPSELRRIRAALAFKDRRQIAQRVWESIARSTYTTRQLQQQEASLRNSRDYPAAALALQQAVLRAREVGYHTSEMQQRFAEFERSFDRTVIDALVADALEARDSVKKSLLLTGAELMRYWHQTGDLSQAFKKSEAGIQDTDEGLHQGELKQRLKVVDGLCRIHRELLRIGP